MFLDFPNKCVALLSKYLNPLHDRRLKMFKRIVCFMVTISILLSTVVVPAFANDGMEDIYAYVKEYALNFMSESQQKSDIEINRFIECYDTEDCVTAFYVTFIDSAHDDCGYVVLSLLENDNNPVAEFGYEGEGVLDIIEAQSLGNSSLTNQNVTANNVKLIYTGPDSYYIPIGSDSYFSVFDNRTVTENEILADYVLYKAELRSSSSSAVTSSVPFDRTKIQNWSDASIKSQTLVTGFSSGSNYFIMKDFSEGNVCAPTAATNMIWYWAKDRSRSSALSKIGGLSKTAAGQKIFNIMKSAMLTSETLGTLDSKVLWGYQSYFDCDAMCDATHPLNSTWNYKELTINSSFSDFKAAIDDGCPIHLMLRMENTITAAGHDVFCIGYAVNTSYNNYFTVMDGWYNYGRYIKSGSYPYVKGYKIWVRP